MRKPGPKLAERSLGSTGETLAGFSSPASLQALDISSADGRAGSSRDNLRPFGCFGLCNPINAFNPIILVGRIQSAENNIRKFDIVGPLSGYQAYQYPSVWQSYRHSFACKSLPLVCPFSAILCFHALISITDDPERFPSGVWTSTVIRKRIFSFWEQLAKSPNAKVATNTKTNRCNIQPIILRPQKYSPTSIV